MKQHFSPSFQVHETPKKVQKSLKNAPKGTRNVPKMTPNRAKLLAKIRIYRRRFSGQWVIFHQKELQVEVSRPMNFQQMSDEIRRMRNDMVTQLLS